MEVIRTKPVEEIEGTETTVKAPYRRVIDELLECGVPEGKDLFQVLNDFFRGSRRASVRPPIAPQREDEGNPQ